MKKKDDFKRINRTESIGELINLSKFSDIVNSDKIALISKYSTIFSFWGDIVGKKFSAFSKPLSIKASKLYVSAKSPVIIQELKLYKEKLLKKINSYSMPLGIEIKDIVFDYKNYKETSTKKDDNFIEDKPENIDDCALKGVELEKKVMDKIKEHIFAINFLNDIQKEALFQKAIDARKAKILRQKS